MSDQPFSGPRTTTIKTKYVWLILVIFLILFALAPVFYYTNSLASPSTPSAPSTPPPTTPPPTNTSTSNSTNTGSGNACVSPCNCPNPCTVVIQNSIFGTGAAGTAPAGTVTIEPGTTVTWSNHDGTSHTTTSNTGVWGSGILSPGEHFSYTFTSPGTYNYHCQIHPMTGVVNVL